jgi:hypothetical protein
MSNFSELWKNPLSKHQYKIASRENKSEFAIRSQNKLEDQPPVGDKYTELINEARAALDLFLLHRSGTDVNIQKAATERLAAIEKALTAMCKSLEATILMTLESDPSVMTEFFPHGRSELHGIKRGDVQMFLERLLDRATFYQQHIGVQWVNKLQSTLNQWKNNFAAQSGAFRTVENARNQFDQAWDELSDTYFRIALNLVLDFPNEPGIADQYFDFSVFHRVGSGTTKEASDSENA